MFKHYSKYLKLVFFAWDIVILNFAWIISFYIKWGDLSKILLKDSITTLVFANLIWAFWGTYKNAYKFIRVEPIETVLSRIFKITLIHVAVMFILIVFLNFDNISRLRILYFYGSFIIELIFFRILFLKILKALRKKGYNYRNIVIVGSDRVATNIYTFLSQDLTFGYRILGFFDETNENIAPNMNYLGKIEDIYSFVLQHEVAEIYFTIAHYDSNKMRDLIDFCENHLIRIKFVPYFSTYTKNRKVSINFYGNTPIISLRKEPLEKPINSLLKRFFDIVFSLTIITTVFTWLFPILIVFVKFSSKGPVFFKQQRSGADNHTFFCYKFRTMHVNKNANLVQATKNDNRITYVGKILRRTNIDELPQFFNVLKGEMAIIGPRPHMIKHTEKYSLLIKNYLVRHYIRPGITGWAQVNGLRGETSELQQMEKRVEYDIWYIENWSLLLDVKIIVKTLINMVLGDKNAG